MPAFVRETDPREPQRKRRERSSLCDSAIPINLHHQTKSLGGTRGVCDPGDPWESNAKSDFKGRSCAVSIFVIF